MSNKKTIVWIEDNPGDDRFDFIFNECDTKGIDIKIVTSLDDLAKFVKKPQEVNVVGVLLDLMIFDSNTNLSMFDSDDTQDKYKNITFVDANSVGELLLKHIIGSGEFEIFNNTKKVCVFTSMTGLYQENLQNSIKVDNIKLELVTKTSDNNYSQLVKNWIHRL